MAPCFFWVKLGLFIYYNMQVGFLFLKVWEKSFTRTPGDGIHHNGLNFTKWIKQQNNAQANLLNLTLLIGEKDRLLRWRTKSKRIGLPAMVGNTIDITLEFEKAGTLIVPATVIEQWDSLSYSTHIKSLWFIAQPKGLFLSCHSRSVGKNPSGEGCKATIVRL